MNDSIEKQIQDKGLNAPRLTPELIDSVIVDASYHLFEGSQLTVCCLTLVNGFTVTGESACVSPENFDAEIGQKVAYGKAKDQIWALEGYLLKQTLFTAGEPLDYIQRMEVEASELNDKKTKLNHFLKSDGGTKLSDEERMLMEGQLRYMNDYFEVLNDRLHLAKS